MSIKQHFKRTGRTVKNWLERLSFRTGVIVLSMCIPFYIVSFAQLALPISTSLKGILWFIFFGLAKTAQYGGLTILGAEGIKRIRAGWKKKKSSGKQA
ncbi:MAG: hypothetical protein J1E02_04850 [Coprobacter sp.]|nr:hypothetical protein [Coprobacter sp.]